MNNKTLRIGTRGSDLALKQTEWVMERLKKSFPDMTMEVIVIKTKGDIMQNVSLARIGGKGIFVKEIEDSLLRGDIDIAVHSMKDVPVDLPNGLEIAATPEREDPRDVLISKKNRKLEELPRGARIGTGSLRRGLQVRSILSDIQIVPLRGNLDTRIKKVEVENLDGAIVAAAGIRRMGWIGRISQFLPVEIMLPAVGQGALGIEMRKEDISVRETVSVIHHQTTWIEVEAERSFLKTLGGGCRLPIAAYAKMEDYGLTLKGLVGSPDGRFIIRDEVTGPIEEYAEIGKGLAEMIMVQGGQAILNEIHKE